MRMMDVVVMSERRADKVSQAWERGTVTIQHASTTLQLAMLWNVPLQSHKHSFCASSFLHKCQWTVFCEVDQNHYCFNFSVRTLSSAVDDHCKLSPSGSTKFLIRIQSFELERFCLARILQKHKVALGCYPGDRGVYPIPWWRSCATTKIGGGGNFKPFGKLGGRAKIIANRIVMSTEGINKTISEHHRSV